MIADDSLAKETIFETYYSKTLFVDVSFNKTILNQVIKYKKYTLIVHKLGHTPQLGKSL